MVMQQQFSDRIADSHINGDHIKKKQKRKTGTLNNIYVAGRWGGKGFSRQNFLTRRSGQEGR